MATCVSYQYQQWAHQQWWVNYFQLQHHQQPVLLQSIIRAYHPSLIICSNHGRGSSHISSFIENWQLTVKDPIIMPTHDSDSEWVPLFSVALRIWGNSTIMTCWGSSVTTQNSPYGNGTPPQWQEQQWVFTAFSVTMTAQHPFAVALGVVAIEHWGFAMINNSTTNHTEENWTWTPLFFLLCILYPPSTSTPAHHPLLITQHPHHFSIHLMPLPCLPNPTFTHQHESQHWQHTRIPAPQIGSTFDTHHSCILVVTASRPTA